MHIFICSLYMHRLIKLLIYIDTYVCADHWRLHMSASSPGTAHFRPSMVFSGPGRELQRIDVMEESANIPFNASSTRAIPNLCKIKQLNPSWRAIWTILRSLFRFYVNVAPHTSSDTHRKACSQTAARKVTTQKSNKHILDLPNPAEFAAIWATGPPHNDQRLFPLLESFSGWNCHKMSMLFWRSQKKCGWIKKTRSWRIAGGYLCILREGSYTKRCKFRSL